VLPDVSLAERAIEPVAEPTAAAVLAPAPKSLVSDAVSAKIMPAKATLVKPSVNVPGDAPNKASVAVTPVKPSSVPAPSKPVSSKPVSSKPAPSKPDAGKVIIAAPPAKPSSVQPALKPTTTVRDVQASSARSYVVRSTAYNSTPGQTDGSPHITATGTRTRFGVVALSRDLLSFIPYGSRIRIQDLSGTSYNAMLANTVFIVEDTMNARMWRKVDVWMGTRSQALNWGSRSIRITVLN